MQRAPRLTLIVGMYAATRFSAQTYHRVLRKILFLIGAVLVWQGAAYFVR